jgi:acyl-CoA reductase-like NAD-dependent aldehyde dehydrogenase
LVRGYRQHIGGEWISSGRKFEDIDPYRGTVMAMVPVVVAQPAGTADEAVAIANSTRYGLSAGLITGDNQRGFALARQIDSGVVHVNDQTVADEPQLPLGGVKDSGWGRSGPASMADFTELQWITTRDGTGSYPI